MSERSPRTLWYYTGSHWLQAGVVAVLLALLLYWLLDGLRDAEEFSERTIVELTVRDMRVGLQLAKGEALLARRDHEIIEWVGSNPVRWLGRHPDGYRGECSSDEAARLAAGTWCFDRGRRELVYRPRNVRYLQLPAGSDGSLRWRVALPPGDKGAGIGTPGVRVEIVTPYLWRKE